jgi:hypothetical protein
MKRHVFSFLFVAQAILATASAQVGATFPGMVQVGGMGQHIVARNLVGLDCQSGKPTGFGTAELFFPYIAGLPDQYLFQDGATVQDQTTATITAVFSKIETSQITNDVMTDVFLKSHLIYYYYHPKSSPKSWDDFDGFQAGQLIAIDQVQKNMFSVVPPGISFVVNSGPWTYTADFMLPDGSIANLRNFMPGGVTVNVFGTLGNFVKNPDGSPHVIDLTNNAGPMKLGSCAITSPFSGSATHPAPPVSSNRRRNAAGDGEDVQ